MSESPDKDTAQAVILVHSSISRLAAQSASCKLWSVVLGSLILILVAGRPGGGILLWGSLPLIFLALADAGYAGKASRLSDLIQKGGSPLDVLKAHGTNHEAPEAFRELAGIMAWSVWPFYLCLGGVIAALGLAVLKVPGPYLLDQLHKEALAGGSGSGGASSNPFGGPPGVNFSQGGPGPGSRGPSQGTGGNPFGARTGTTQPSALNQKAVPPGAIPPGTPAQKAVPGLAPGSGGRPSNVPPGILNRAPQPTVQPGSPSPPPTNTTASPNTPQPPGQ